MIAITRIVVTGFAPRIQAKIIPINVVGIDKRTSVKKDNTASIHFPPSYRRNDHAGKGNHDGGSCGIKQSDRNISAQIIRSK